MAAKSLSAALRDYLRDYVHNSREEMLHLFELAKRTAKDGRDVTQIFKEIELLYRDNLQILLSLGKSMNALEESLVRRNRASSPKTVCRNVEICDKREQDKKKWTLGKLAKDYKMTRQSVVNILKDEAKWRRLARKV
jgi:hypothetical protein